MIAHVDARRERHSPVDGGGDGVIAHVDARRELHSPVDGGGDGVIAHVDARRADEVRAAEEVRLGAARRIHEVDEADLDVFFVE